MPFLQSVVFVLDGFDKPLLKLIKTHFLDVLCVTRPRECIYNNDHVHDIFALKSRPRLHWCFVRSICGCDNFHGWYLILYINMIYIVLWRIWYMYIHSCSGGNFCDFIRVSFEHTQAIWIISFRVFIDGNRNIIFNICWLYDSESNEYSSTIIHLTVFQKDTTWT